jgi:ferritin-like metal-binding protein YciE
MLGLNRAADMLQQTLDEEGQTDEQLTSLAQRINVKAQR